MKLLLLNQRNYILTLLFLLLSALGMSAQTVTIDGIKYSLYSNMSVHQATIVSNSYRGDIVIPSTVTYNDYVYNVIAVGNSAFSNCSYLSSITLPNSISAIGSSAFSGCSNIIELQIPSSVTTIGTQAFQGCTKLYSVNIPDGIEKIENSTFRNCSSLHEIVIPASVTNIGDYAFQNTMLTSIDLPTSITTIGKYAFSNTSLQSVILPSSLSRIDTYLFQNCQNLTSVTIPNSIQSIGSYAFNGCPNLTEISIPNSVTSIGQYAFGAIVSLTIDSYPVMDFLKGSSSLKSVTIGNSVDKIKSSSFSGCTNLESVTFSSTVKTIEGSAFYGCKSLTTLNLPNELTSIGASAFAGCTSLTRLVIPDNVVSIYQSAFAGCSGITSINIGNSVKIIGKSAFYGCTSITNLVIPASVETIGQEAFRGCTSLTSLSLSEGLKTIGIGAFRGCNSLLEVTIPSSVELIDNEAFLGCTSLANVVIPENITEIGVDAFTNTAWMNGQPDGVIYIGSLVYGFKGVMPPNTSIDFRAGTTVILSSAFANCTGLSELTIPSTITKIGSYAFASCSNLQKVNVEDLAAWCNIDFGNAESNPLKFAKEVYYSGVPQTSLIIPNGVLEIKKYAFTGFTALNTITLPSTVTKLGDGAFSGCTELLSVSGMINSAISEIGSNVFENSKITSIDIPATIKTISYNAFNKIHLERINIADVEAWCNMQSYSGLPLYEYQLLLNGQPLNDLNIPSSVVSIPSYRFAYVSNIETVSFSNSLETIGSYAFMNCKALTSFSVPASVKRIDSHAFEGCTNVWIVTLEGDMVWGIQDRAFYGINKVLFKSETPVSLSSKYNSIISKTEGSLYIPDNVFDTYLNSYGEYYQTYRCVSYNADMIGVEIDGIESTSTSINVKYHYISLDSSQPISDALASQTGIYKKGGLTPNKTYSGSMNWTMPSGNQIWIPSFSSRTQTLTLEPVDPEAVSNAVARISAITNGDDDTQRFGFEWRRNDAPETTPWNKVISPIFKGSMAGTLSGLSSNTYYDFRPFYQPDDGDIIYGSKKTFITADAYVAFQPEVYTYDVSMLGDNSATIRGYILSGSETIIEQGFEYWPSLSASVPHISIIKVPRRASSIIVEGEYLELTLTGLMPGTEYTYRPYAKTNSGITYGEEMYFRTTGSPATTSIERTESFTNSSNYGKVYSITGHLVTTDVQELNSLPKGIYIVNGRKMVVK